MSWPSYFKDKLIIGNQDSEIGIVCLWTPISFFDIKIDKNKFALMGQLYSKEGINFILRNILAKPRIRKIIVCGEERTGSGHALIKFFENGIDNKHEVMGTDHCEIHKEISQKAIEELRQNVSFENLIGTIDIEKINHVINSYQQKDTDWAEPQIFAETKIEFDGVMPSDNSVFKIRKKYAGQVWLEILKKIMKFGTIRESFHGNNCKELFNIATVITDEDANNFKTFPYFQISKNDIENYLPKFMTGIKGTADYTYGERLWNFPKFDNNNFKYNQVDDVIVDFLSRYPTDRAACAAIFGINDHIAESAPCLCFIQATNVDNKLDLTVYFRSHDIFGGWLLNAFGLRKLQQYIADKLKWQVGNLTMFSNCAHIYDNNWKLAKDLINKYGNELDCESDPRGFLIIKIENNEIIVTHTSPNGKKLQEFRQNALEPKATMKLYNRLVLADVVSLINHAFDIGAELMKAEIAVKQGVNYTQDQEIRFD